MSASNSRQCKLCLNSKAHLHMPRWDPWHVCIKLKPGSRVSMGVCCTSRTKAAVVPSSGGG
jgi:hypothetical protein